MVKGPAKHWSMKTAIAQIEKCGFECEGGNIASNDAWLWMKGSADVGPEFWPGQGVWMEVTAEAAGKTLRQSVHFYIVGCRMGSDSERRYWSYDLSWDPPQPYHYGVTHFQNIRGEKLSLEKPEMPGDIKARASGATP